jgi:hypothetical protein
MTQNLIFKHNCWALTLTDSPKHERDTINDILCHWSRFSLNEGKCERSEAKGSTAAWKIECP